MLDDKLRECLTFDDVLLAPAYSEVLPKDVDVRTRLCRGLELAFTFSGRWGVGSPWTQRCVARLEVRP